MISEIRLLQNILQTIKKVKWSCATIAKNEWIELEPIGENKRLKRSGNKDQPIEAPTNYKICHMRFLNVNYVIL